MLTSIATVCISGSLEEKMLACARAGFDGIEIFEPDLVVSPMSPEEVRALADRLGLTLDLYQPFRDFEGVGEEQLQANLRRAEAKFALMNRLGIDTMLLCTNVGTATIDDDELAASQLRRLGELAASFGVRIAYEALAWGRFVNTYRHAYRIVELADHPAVGTCLDSFHILSRGDDPAGIEGLDPQRIFFVQLADAPVLSMDILSWSRHYRVFPGQGGFDLKAFLAHLVRVGYRGPVSLEIFNDTFRQSNVERTAVDALRSLLWLQDQTAALLAAEAAAHPASAAHDGATATGAPTTAISAPATPAPGAPATGPREARTGVVPGDRMQLASLPPVEPPKGVDFAEIRTEDPEAVAELLSQLGFDFIGQHRRKPVQLWVQGQARIIINEQRAQGDAPMISALGFQVGDPDAGVRRAVELKASPVPRHHTPDEQELRAVSAPDGTEVFFGHTAEHPEWMDEFAAAARSGAPALIGSVDHVNLAQPWQAFDEAVLFYESALRLDSSPATEVPSPLGLVRSQVMRTGDGAIRLALNIVPQVLQDRGPRATAYPEHVAFRTHDIKAVARRARQAGMDFLEIPENYYEDLAARFGLGADVLAELRALQLLYDRDEHGSFLHFYTRTVGELFFEVVQRTDDYDGYGAPNAPVRLASQFERNRRQTR